MSTTTATDVFSPREIARAAGVHRSVVRSLLASGELATVDGWFVAGPEALRAVRRLRGEVSHGEHALFSPGLPTERPRGRALAASGSLHVIALALIATLTSLGVVQSQPVTEPEALTRLVFLATPGPGGGGGGGGLRQPTPPPRAELKGTSALESPIPPPKRLSSRKPSPEPRPAPPPRPAPAERPVDPPPPAKTEPLPQVVAPVATAPADPSDRAGLPTESTSESASNGSGTGGGAGSGDGTGLGQGSGPGIGPGSGGGTGGGPYRPGSGITPPAIMREVKPDYTEDARRRAVEGDVVLEIVVRRDGSVGQVRLLQGLGAGLDERAIDAVRQWRFSPAHRYGVPVDVMVEVAVEFKLR